MRKAGPDSLPDMPLADEFQEIVDSLPSDWTDLEFDHRVEEDRYIDAASGQRVSCPLAVEAS